MKKFTIKGTRTLNEFVTYTVEAETQEDAIEMVESGDIEDNDDHWQIEISGGEDFTIVSEHDVDPSLDIY